MTIATNLNQCLFTIKDIQSQLSLLALNSLDEDAKRIFHETSLSMDDVKKDLQTRVLELERLEPQYKGS
jgi:hypothetical protein